MYRVFQYFGCDDGWRCADYVDQTTAARRRLRRAVAATCIYAIRRKHSSHNLDLSDLPFACCAMKFYAFYLSQLFVVTLGLSSSVNDLQRGSVSLEQAIIRVQADEYRNVYAYDSLGTIAGDWSRHEHDEDRNDPVNEGMG